MAFSRNFFHYSSEDQISMYRAEPAPGKDGRAHLALYTSFFSDGHGRVLRTNSQYLAFKNEVYNTVSNVNTIDPITLDIFEATESDEFDRETSIIGFRKYMASCYYSFKRQFVARCTVFTLFLVIGLLMIFLLHTLNPAIPDWLFYCLETIATVFIWQFAGFAAFELGGEVKQMRRFRQIADAEFTFRKWE